MRPPCGLSFTHKVGGGDQFGAGWDGIVALVSLFLITIYPTSREPDGSQPDNQLTEGKKRDTLSESSRRTGMGRRVRRVKSRVCLSKSRPCFAANIWEHG